VSRPDWADGRDARTLALESTALSTVHVLNYIDHQLAVYKAANPAGEAAAPKGAWGRLRRLSALGNAAAAFEGPQKKPEDERFNSASILRRGSLAAVGWARETVEQSFTNQSHSKDEGDCPAQEGFLATLTKSFKRSRSKNSADSAATQAASVLSATSARPQPGIVIV